MSLDLSVLRKLSHQHKFDHGHCLVLSGPRNRTGAARLSARAALRVGAGLVTLGAQNEALPEHAAQVTEIMLAEVTDGPALSQLLERDGRINALCLGPALGLDTRAAGLVDAALQARRATVLDADALSLIANDQPLRAQLHKLCVLTPHEGEFRRLFPRADLKNRKGAVEEAAKALGATVLLKGALTAIAAPGKRAVLLDSRHIPHAAWLATAGAGDVLAGLIAGLVARGLAPTLAAKTGVTLHVQAAEVAGPGLVAGDLPEALPQVFRRLGV